MTTTSPELLCGAVVTRINDGFDYAIACARTDEHECDRDAETPAAPWHLDVTADLPHLATALAAAGVTEPISVSDDGYHDVGPVTVLFPPNGDAPAGAPDDAGVIIVEVEYREPSGTGRTVTARTFAEAAETIARVLPGARQAEDATGTREAAREGMAPLPLLWVGPSRVGDGSPAWWVQVPATRHEHASLTDHGRADVAAASIAASF